MNLMKQEFDTVIQKLLPLGENPDEMHFWAGIFNDLSETEQRSVLTNLKEELTALQLNAATETDVERGDEE